MNLKKIILLFSVFFLFLCKKKEERLFFIDTYEDLIQKATATGLTPISKEKKTVLTVNEIINRHRTYKLVDTIFKNETFNAIVILSQGKGKSYDFLVRTIQQGDNKVMGTFLLAGYNEDLKQFCSGFINSDLELKRYCKSDNFTFKKKINEQGRIVEIP